MANILWLRHKETGALVQYSTRKTATLRKQILSHDADGKAMTTICNLIENGYSEYLGHDGEMYCIDDLTRYFYPDQWNKSTTSNTQN